MFGVIEFLGLAALFGGIDPDSDAAPDAAPIDAPIDGRAESAQDAAPGYIDIPADEESAAMPLGAHGWDILYAGALAAAAGHGAAPGARRPALLDPDTATVPLVDGFDPENDSLVIGFDPLVNPEPEVAVEIVSDPDGHLFQLIRLDGQPVARLPVGAGTPPIAPEQIALVPDSDIADGGGMAG